jgi:PTH1 family peptidyl-tRNA hydrolase
MEVCGCPALLPTLQKGRVRARKDRWIMYDIFEKLKSLNTAPTVTGTPEFLVVGLGNPEPKYDTTRHNAGFMAIDHIAQKTGCKVNQLKFKSLCGMCEIEGKKVMLIKPTTYMNSSGEAVREAAAFYKIPPEKTIIIFDDISLDVGKMRIRRKGSDGGHNGIKSIIYLTGSDQFPRIKVGVGKKPHPDYDLAAWVLGHFSAEELKMLEEVYEHCYQALGEMLKGNIDRAMNLFN